MPSDKVWLKLIAITYLQPPLFSKSKSARIVGSLVYEKLCEVLRKKRLVKAIEKSSSSGQTSALEGYHSVINQFAPKMLAYSYLGMMSR